MVEPPQPKQGWLQKQGELGWKSWSRRFFALDAGGIAYYLEEDKKTQKGTIPLQSIVSASTAQPPATELIFPSSGGYLQIYTNQSKNNRIYYLYCDSKEDAMHWIIAINYWRDYASNSGFGPKPPGTQTTPPPQSAALPPPSLYPPASTPAAPSTYDPLIPSAPPMESPYEQFVQYQNNLQTQTQQPLYQPPPTTVTPIPPPQVPYIPPNGGAPLRTIDENVGREILFTEGDHLKAYMDMQVSCCNFLMQQQLQIPSHGNEKKMHILCVYLVMSSLDWDNRNTPPTQFWCAPAYESDGIFQFFEYLLALIRQEIMSVWPVDGPTVVTQIDTWIKRKRKDHQALVQQEDREAFIRRNLLILSYLHTARLFEDNPKILDAALKLMDRLIQADEQLPHFRYSEMVWKAVDMLVPPQEKAQTKTLIWGYLLFQKLKLEDDQFKFTARDPFLANHITTVLTLFHNALSAPSLVPVKRESQNQYMKVFGMWQRDLPLLGFANNPNVTSSVIILYNMRIVGRIAVKMGAFPQLSDGLYKLKAALEQRMKQEAVHAVHNNTPFPVLTNQANPGYNPNIMTDDMTELGQVIQKALSNLYYS